MVGVGRGGKSKRESVAVDGGAGDGGSIIGVYGGGIWYVENKVRKLRKCGDLFWWF